MQTHKGYKHNSCTWDSKGTAVPLGWAKSFNYLFNFKMHIYLSTFLLEVSSSNKSFLKGFKLLMR